jgi:hypothetical protein
MVYIEKGKLQVLLLILCVWWSTTSIHVKAENDSMKPGDTLNATSKLCSKKGSYCMNFDTTSDNLAYLNIFAQGEDGWVVWIAKRNQPVDINSAVLSLDYSGVLKIESRNRKPMILYSPPQPFNNSTIIATLLDTGNFVLQDIQTKTELWRSFDYPTDSLLPGMKLGVNHKTGEKWSLVSQISESIPASGPFQLEWDPRRKELVIMRKEKVYWTSGELMKNGTFEYISGEEFKYNIGSSEEEEYFTYKTSNDSLGIWTLLQTGQLINRNGSDIARADLCYGYNTNGGCQKWGEAEIPTCRNPGDMFDSKTGYIDVRMLNSIENASYGISDCQASCWSNCSCIGFLNFNGNGTGCAFLVTIKGLNIASSGKTGFYILVKNTNHKGLNVKFSNVFYSLNIYILICIILFL